MASETTRTVAAFPECANVTPSAGVVRLALGVVYLHFGFLKFYPDLSPAEGLATQTIMHLTGQAVSAHQSLLLLAVFETLIGLCFLLNLFPKTTAIVFTIHMLGTLTPLFVLPEYVFKFAPWAPTLEGQYILKNLVFLAAGWTVFGPEFHKDHRRQRGVGI